MIEKDMQVEEFVYTIDRCGNSAHVRMSKKWLGKKVKVRIETISDWDYSGKLFLLVYNKFYK